MFVWMALPLAAYIVFAVYGAPHAIWSYSFRDNGHPYDPLVRRDYIDCTFWGPYGRFTVPADHGRCAWVKFFKMPD